MKKPFTNYLKLLLKFLRVDEFNVSVDDCYRTDGYKLVYKSERIAISEEVVQYPRRKKYYSVQYGTGEIKFYSSEEAIEITLRTFQKSDYDLKINADINGKDEFFNYIMQNNADYLTYEDVEVLKEIKNLTIKITQKDIING